MIQLSSLSGLSDLGGFKIGHVQYKENCSDKGITHIMFLIFTLLSMGTSRKLIPAPSFHEIMFIRGFFKEALAGGKCLRLL